MNQIGIIQLTIMISFYIVKSVETRYEVEYQPYSISNGVINLVGDLFTSLGLMLDEVSLGMIALLFPMSQEQTSNCPYDKVRYTFVKEISQSACIIYLSDSTGGGIRERICRIAWSNI